MQGLRKKLYTLEGETPSQKNSQTFNRKTKTLFKSAVFRKWAVEANRQILAQGVPSTPYEQARIVVTFYHADLRRRDGENALSSIQDLLVKCGVIVDDCWTRIETPRVYHDLAREARCEILVTEIEPIDWKARMKEVKG